jgi:hypothetical protein
MKKKRKTNYSIDVTSRLTKLTIKLESVIRTNFHFRCKFELQMQMQKKNSKTKKKIHEKKNVEQLQHKSK